MIKEVRLDLSKPEQLAQVARALGSDIRIRILEMLDETSMSIVELAQRLHVPVSTVSNNVVVLEEADLVRSERQTGIRGTVKLCSLKQNELHICLGKPREYTMHSIFQPMPIGQYVECVAEPVCGLLDDRGSIGRQDDPSSFYDPEHHRAQLLWFEHGFVEYRFSNQALRDYMAKTLEFSFEACSEAPNYRKDWPSDITVWVNGVELGTWTCPSDFGGRRGRYSPEWWGLAGTHFGLLKRWRIDEDGCQLDDQPLSSVKLSQLHLESLPYISLRIGIRADAIHRGGINLFGEGFGDYPQGIVMRMDCIDKMNTEETT